jgi:hypothetical protein
MTWHLKTRVLASAQSHVHAVVRSSGVAEMLCGLLHDFAREQMRQMQQCVSSYQGTGARQLVAAAS